jgi:ABC-type molybdenum transport system ATPase subunit/photorepair protein PhrA
MNMHILINNWFHHERKRGAYMTYIIYQGVELGYRDRIVLKNLNLTVQQNDYIGIVGPNGSGKTTFNILFFLMI